MKFYLFVIILILFFVLPSSAPASSCYQYQGQEICIISLKRSAKYYWEYRTSLKINGVPYPQEIYDCRHQIITNSRGEKAPFKAKGVGEFLCQKVNKSS